MIPFANLFKQQPHPLCYQAVLKECLSETDQKRVLRSLDGVDSKYKFEVLKKFIVIIEAGGSEVSPSLWEEYYEQSSLKTSSASEPDSSICYTVCESKAVEIRENRNSLVAHGDTGHRTWESSLALTEYICEKNETMKEKIGDVVELGAGTGLVSLAIATLGISDKVYCTDGSVNVMTKLEETIQLNKLDEIVKPMLLEWEDLDSASALPKHCTVYAGDVLYGMTESYPAILNLLELLEPSKIYICNPIRNEETYAYFKTLCESRGMEIILHKRFSGSSLGESKYMAIVSIPPIPLEIIELVLPKQK